MNVVVKKKKPILYMYSQFLDGFFLLSRKVHEKSTNDLFNRHKYKLLYKSSYQIISWSQIYGRQLLKDTNKKKHIKLNQYIYY